MQCQTEHHKTWNIKENQGTQETEILKICDFFQLSDVRFSRGGGRDNFS